MLEMTCLTSAGSLHTQSSHGARSNAGSGMPRLVLLAIHAKELRRALTHSDKWSTSRGGRRGQSLRAPSSSTTREACNTSGKGGTPTTRKASASTMLGLPSV